MLAMLLYAMVDDGFKRYLRLMGKLHKNDGKASKCNVAENSLTFNCFQAETHQNLLMHFSIRISRLQFPQHC